MFYYSSLYPFVLSWGEALTKDEGGWDEGVELGVELGRNVEGVAEDADHQGPLHLSYLHC